MFVGSLLFSSPLKVISALILAKLGNGKPLVSMLISDDQGDAETAEYATMR